MTRRRLLAGTAISRIGYKPPVFPHADAINPSGWAHLLYFGVVLPGLLLWQRRKLRPGAALPDRLRHFPDHDFHHRHAHRHVAPGRTGTVDRAVSARAAWRGLPAGGRGGLWPGSGLHASQVAPRERGSTDVVRSDPYPTIECVALSASGAAQALVHSDGQSSGNSHPNELAFQRKRVGRGFRTVTAPTVDWKGEHVAYVVVGEDGETVAIDDQPKMHESYDHVVEMAFDPAGKRLAFVANKGGTRASTSDQIEGGEWFVVVRDVSGSSAAVEQPHFRLVQDLVRDPSGERLAYRVRDGEGDRLPRFADRTMGFGTRDDREIWWRSVDLP